MTGRNYMDGITIGALSQELHLRLTDSLVDRIAMTDRHTLVLYLYSQKDGRSALVLGAIRPVRLRTYFRIRAARAHAATFFTMFMRKHFRARD